MNRDYFWALAGFGVVAIAALTLGLSAFAQASDDTARRREEAVVLNGLDARIDEIESQVISEAAWDDAVRFLDNRFDPAWAHDNIGVYLSNAGHFGFAIVIDGDDQALYAMRDGKDVAPAGARTELDAARPLVARVRSGERTRGAGATFVDTIQASAPAWVGGRLYILSASLIQPDFGHARIRHARAPIIVTGREMNDEFIAAFGRRYLLSNLHVHEGDSRLERNEAHAVIRDDAGALIATLDWTPRTQGRGLLRSILPWMLGLLLALLAAMLVLYSRARGAARRLLVSERQSWHMAYHDALTGLPNRAFFEEALADAVSITARTRGTFALHCIDLDRFKELNDAYGHQVGDEVLKEVAARLSRLCDGVATCARLGGDEFAVLQDGAGLDEVTALARTIVEALSEPFALSVGIRLVGCSVGAAISGDEHFAPLEMLRRADMALYRAKAEGRGCFRFFDFEMDRAFQNVQRLKHDLATDLAAGRLQMVYQPQVRISGEVVGVEALVRWTHAEDGPIPPSVFVPLAEESGLIGILGEFTLRRAAEDSLRWPGVKTAVNISATQLQAPGFVSEVRRIVRETGADPRAIEIELTEGVLFSHEEETRAALDALHDAGFSIALDDFGTGYSSLSYLPRLPIDKIKIDRSFVSSLGHNRKADALFGAIVRLAQALDIRVIAEGVETNEQWVQLSAAGCDKIQGYVASRPLDAAAALAFMHGRGARSVAGGCEAAA